MVMRSALSFALFLFIIQNIFGMDYIDSVMNSLLFFVLAFIIGLGIETLYRHIRVRIKMIVDEEREREDADRNEMEDVSKAKASAISKLFSDGK